ncbi:hypothetical protein ARMGADRAFT_1079651 [Armillaria gallica]|uniref:Uncharacterized protein n=1 Tax=Armillaria gallica TaxID=47427 RepID=A0A2H3DYJ8_ARMGA|nr:hypothetical protein ARMGADRAFT_1079651 [Armillaria gallica]
MEMLKGNSHGVMDLVISRTFQNKYFIIQIRLSPSMILWADQELPRPAMRKVCSAVKLPGRPHYRIAVVDSLSVSASSSLLGDLSTNVGGGRTVDYIRDASDDADPNVGHHRTMVLIPVFTCRNTSIIRLGAQRAYADCMLHLPPSFYHCRRYKIRGISGIERDVIKAFRD